MICLVFIHYYEWPGDDVVDVCSIGHRGVAFRQDGRCFLAESMTVPILL
ncbi:hypothetical protein ACFY30_18215 [Streptomyces sp. NPDC000345]